MRCKQPQRIKICSLNEKSAEWSIADAMSHLSFLDIKAGLWQKLRIERLDNTHLWHVLLVKIGLYKTMFKTGIRQGLMLKSNNVDGKLTY